MRKGIGNAGKVTLCMAALIAAAQTPDPRIGFTEPASGRVFAPGERLRIVLRIDPPLHPTDAIISLSGLGMLYGSDAAFNGSTFRWQYQIPLAFAGPLTVTPLVVAGMDPAHPDTPLTIGGRPVTIVVKPKEAPVKLRLAQHDFYLEPNPAGDKHCLYVQGEFRNVSERDLSSPATGTTYHSNAPSVAAVDGEGCVRAAGPGIATVTAENRGIKDFATFVVEDPRHPLPPQDVTRAVSISRSAIRRDPNAKAYNTYPLRVQSITITNTSGEPIPGPLFLTVRDLPKGAELWTKTANAPANPPPDMTLFSRQNLAAGKSASVRLEPKDGLKLVPGETVTAQLYFLYSGGAPSCLLGVVRSSDADRIP